MNLLLAVDGSDYSVRAAKFVATHFNGLPADTPRLHLLHVKLPIPRGLVARAESVVGDAAVQAYYREEAEAALAPVEAVLREAHIPFESHWKTGDICAEIQAFVAAHGIDMIVMGSHGHGALGNLLLGSVASKTLATASVPVLIVR